jgi:hypothetical protein
MKITLGKVSNMKAVPYTEMEKMLGNKLLWVNTEPQGITKDKVVFDGLLAELVLKVHEKHPTYAFKAKWFSYATSEQPRVMDIFIMFNKVVLGGVSVYADKFTISNDRIHKVRPRTGYMTTTDVKRARSEITKYFKPETAAEIMKKHADNVRSVVYNTEQVAKTRHGIAASIVSTCLLDHIMTNLDTYRDIAKSHGATDNMLGAAKLAYDEWSVLNSSIGCEFEGYIVHIREGLYMVGDRRKEKVCDVYEAKDLPAHINDKLGQLKLVQDNTHIRNVGMRVDDNTFYIRGERI